MGESLRTENVLIVQHRVDSNEVGRIECFEDLRKSLLTASLYVVGKTAKGQRWSVACWSSIRPFPVLRHRLTIKLEDVGQSQSYRASVMSSRYEIPVRLEEQSAHFLLPFTPDHQAFTTSNRGTRLLKATVSQTEVLG